MVQGFHIPEPPDIKVLERSLVKIQIMHPEVPFRPCFRNDSEANKEV